MSGTYEKAGYFDGDQLREWEDISQNHLAQRVAKSQTKLVLDRKELRAALIGVGESAGVRLELIPSTNYDAFINVFLSLLSLKRTKDSDLKSMLLDSLGGEIQIRSLDLARNFEQLSRGIETHSYTLKLLEGNEAAARELETTHRQLKELSDGLPEEWARLNDGLDQAVRSLLGQASVQEESIGVTKEQITVHDRSRRGAVVGAGQENDNSVRFQTKIDEIDELAAKFFGLNPDAVAEQPRLIQAQLSPLLGQAELRTNPGSRKAIEDTISSLGRDRARKEAILASPDATWSASLLGECDNKLRESVLRIIHPAILALPEGADGVEIKSPDALFRSISELEWRVRDGIYDDEGIRVNLNSIPVPAFGVFDPTVVEREIESIQAEERRLQDLLARVSDYDALHKKIAVLQGQKEEADRFLVRYQDWCKKEEGRPEHENDRQRALKACVDWKAKAASLTAEIEQLEDRVRVAVEQAKACRDSAAVLRQEASVFPSFMNSDWPLPELAPSVVLPQAHELKGLLDAYKKRFAKAASNYDLVTQGLKMLQTNLGSLLPGNDMDAMMRGLVEEVDSIPARREALLAEKKALVAQASKKFSDFHKGFDSVKALVSKINKNLSEIQVSNLKSVHIVMGVTSQLSIIEGLLESQNVQMDKDGIEKAVKSVLERMEDKKPFALDDLFEIQIKVVTGRGEVKLYKSLDAAESTGTAMTFKVVLMAMILREIAKVGGNTRIKLPLFVDEADTLDDTNRTTILKIAEKLGFNVVMASPNAVPAHRVYFLHATDGGKTWITAEDEHLLLEREADDEVEVDLVAANLADDNEAPIPGDEP